VRTGQEHMQVFSSLNARCCGSPQFVTTLQGRLSQQGSGGACAILGMTLSCVDLVFDRLVS